MFAGESALRLIRRLFLRCRQRRGGELTQERFVRLIGRIRESFETVIVSGLARGGGDTPSACAALRKHGESHWLCVVDPQLEPSNHQAERALRPAVLWRKRSHGHRSDGGGEYVEVMLTVCGSLDGQGRSIAQYLGQAARANPGTPAHPPSCRADAP